MSEASQTLLILMADDDPDDRMFAADALKESRVANKIDFVVDGEELMEYLRHNGRYAHLAGQPLPGLILLDLNMPRMDGREALGAIRGDERLRHIPIVILTTSKAEEDVYRSYNLGANSYIIKPVTFDGLVQVMKDLGRYWFKIVELPPPGRIPEVLP